MRAQLPEVIRHASEQLTALWQAVIDAFEAEQRGEIAEAVRGLLQAGRLEESASRHAEAEQWYVHALGIAETLRDRRPEIEALRLIGGIATVRGELERAARCFQRSFALANVERETRAAALACLSLGGIAAARSQWAGAESWLANGLQYAKGDDQLTARLALALGEVALERGEYDTARERFRCVLGAFESARDVEGAVRTWHARGTLAAREGQLVEAFASYAEALNLLDAAGTQSGLAIDVRLSRCDLLLEQGRLPEAEDELRQCEELAIVNDVPSALVLSYVGLGKLCGLQGDENGFVFFEKALELAAGQESEARLVADVWLAYGHFQWTMGRQDDARPCLERARAFLERMGDEQALCSVDADIARLAVG